MNDQQPTFKPGEFVYVPDKFNQEPDCILWLKTESGWEKTDERPDEIDFPEVLAVDFHTTPEGETLELVTIDQEWYEDIGNNCDPKPHHYIVEAKYLATNTWYKPFDDSQQPMIRPPSHFVNYQQRSQHTLDTRIDAHLLIRTGEFTVYDMSKGIEYEFHRGLITDSDEVSIPKLTARSIHTEDVWAMTIAEADHAFKFWQWLQVHAKTQRDLDNDINEIIPF